MGSSLGITSSTSLSHARTAPDDLGRVFSTRRLRICLPDLFTPLLGGMLVDTPMEPALQSPGWLSTLFGWMTGKDPGSGKADRMTFLDCYHYHVARRLSGPSGAEDGKNHS